MTSENGEGVFRTSFSEADYIGEEIPAGHLIINVLVGQFEQNMQLTSRFMTDIDITGNSNENNKLYHISVWPNPFSNYLIIENLSQEGRVSIINSKGQTIRKVHGINGDLQMLTDDIAPGLYIIQFNGKDGSYQNFKILKN